MNARELARQVTRTGALALPIVAVGAACAGAAWSALHAGAARDLAELVRRAPAGLGPVLALVLAAAPVGAAQAGEIGALREGQQLAWLRASGRSVLAHVVASRVLASALVMPLAALVATAAVLAAATARSGAGVAPLARLALGDVGDGALCAAGGGALLGLVACATGLFSRSGVARTAARAAALSLAVAAGLALALVAARAA